MCLGLPRMLPDKVSKSDLPRCPPALDHVAQHSYEAACFAGVFPVSKVGLCGSLYYGNPVPGPCLPQLAHGSVQASTQQA